MKMDGKCFRTWGCLVLLSVWVACSLNANDSLERALKLESVLYSLEVQGDASTALEMIVSDAMLSGSEGREDPELLLLKIRCLLAKGELREAKDLYRELKRSDSSDSSWIDTANQLVPESFIEREVPWKNDLMHFYEAIQTNGSLTSPSKPIDYSFFQVSLVESEWNIHCWQVGSSFRSFIVQLDQNSLEVKSTQIDDLPLWEIERNWLGLASENRNGSQLKIGSNWLLNGLLLQQCGFDLGYEQSLRLFSVDTGGEEQVAVSVESKALVELPDQDRRPCWIAEVNRDASEKKWESYAFADNESRTLTRYETDGISIILSPGSLSKIEGGNESFLELIPSRLESDQRRELRVFVGIKSDLRIYLLKGPFEWFDNGDEIELSEAGVISQLGERILQIREKKIGSMDRNCPSSARSGRNPGGIWKC